MRDNGEFVVSQPSSAAAYLHVQAPTTTQTSVTFELYSNTGAVARDSTVVTINAGETVSVLLHHRISSAENLTVRVLGTSLDLVIRPESRVEITLLRRWQPPELIISGHEYPWSSGTYSLGSDIEDYHTLHITGQNGYKFVSKTISPLGMMRDTVKTTPWSWIINIEKLFELTFTGDCHNPRRLQDLEHLRRAMRYPGSARMCLPGPGWGSRRAFARRPA